MHSETSHEIPCVPNSTNGMECTSGNTVPIKGMWAIPWDSTCTKWYKWDVQDGQVGMLCLLVENRTSHGILYVPMLRLSVYTIRWDIDIAQIAHFGDSGTKKTGFHIYMYHGTTRNPKFSIDIAWHDRTTIKIHILERHKECCMQVYW